MKNYLIMLQHYSPINNFSLNCLYFLVAYFFSVYFFSVYLFAVYLFFFLFGF